MNIYTERAVHKSLQHLGALADTHSKVEQSVIYHVLIRNINKLYATDTKGIVKCEDLHH